ncbi:MAG: Rieske 2Fe-2S domain-containing protein [Syntrophobacterales bacterium]
MTDRRGFLQFILAALGLTAVGCFAYPLVRVLSPFAGVGPGSTVTIDKKDIPMGDAKDLVLNDLPIIVINRPEKGYIALSRVCTHRGCLVEYQKGTEILLCPCHGGKCFTPWGLRLCLFSSCRWSPGSYCSSFISRNRPGLLRASSAS